MKKAIILCSGGLDSVVTAFLAKKLNYNTTLLFFDYDQNSLGQERNSAKYFAKKLNSKFIEIKIQNLIPKNSLNSKIKIVPSKNLKNTKYESQKFYVPQRNLIFLSIATAIAESLTIGAHKQAERVNINKTRSVQFARQRIDLFVGFKNEGSEFFPDTTPEFVKNFNNLIKKSTSRKVSLKAPLIKKDKEEIIQLGKSLKIELEKTFSCYAPTKNKHCGICLACKLRKAGFYWANEKDKTQYNY